MFKKIFAILVAVLFLPVAFSPSNANAGIVTGLIDDFQAVAPSAGWQYLWNNSGGIGDPAHYSNLVYCECGGQQLYTTDGTPIPTAFPGDFTYMASGSTHPGPSAAQSGDTFDRYAIAAYTVGVDGAYSIARSFIQREFFLAGASDGVRLIVHVNNDAPVFDSVVGGKSEFDRRAYHVDIPLGDLSAGDTIYVAVGPNNFSFHDSMFIDFSISIDRNAANLFVPGEYATIQEAVDAASPGDHIHVAAGNFAGAIIDKQLKISGVGDQTVITDAPVSGVFRNAFRLISGADMTEISDLSITLSAAPGNLSRTGIFGGSLGAAVVATNVDVRNITFVGLNRGIFIRNTSGWRVTDNIFDGLRESTLGSFLSFGIGLSGSGDSLIANNTIFHDNAASSNKVYVGINLTGPTENNRVTGNTASVDAAGALKSSDIELFDPSASCAGPMPALVIDNKIVDNDADVVLTPLCLIDFNEIN